MNSGLDLLNATLNSRGIVLTNFLNDSVFMKGAKLFLSDLTVVLMIVGGLVAVIGIIMQLIKLISSSAEEAPKYLKHARTIVIVGIAIFMVSGTFKLIMSKYWKIDIKTGTEFEEALKEEIESLKTIDIADKTIYLDKEV